MPIEVKPENTKILVDNGLSRDLAAKSVTKFRNQGLSDEQITTRFNLKALSLKKDKNIIDTFKLANETAKYKFSSGERQTDIARLNIKEMFGQSNEIQKQELEKLESIQEVSLKKDGKFIEGVGIISGQLPILGKFIKATVVSAVGGGAIGAAVGSVVPVVGTITGAGTSALWGSRVGAASTAFELEAGLARSEFKQIRDEEGNTMPMALINGGSAAVGAINASLEFVGMSAMVKVVPGGKKILSTLTKGTVSKVLKNKTIQAELFKVLKTTAKTSATEAGTEGMQEITNIIIGGAIKLLSEQEFKAGSFEDHARRTLESAYAGGLMGGFFGFGGSSTEVATKVLVKQGKSVIEAKKEVAEMNVEQKKEIIESNPDKILEIEKEQIQQIKDVEAQKGVDVEEVKLNEELGKAVAKQERKKLVLTPEQESFKNTSYEILAKATGLNEKELKTALESTSPKLSKKREKIQELVENSEDKIDAFLPEWVPFFGKRDFFNDPQLNQGKDLAVEALDVITNKSYESLGIREEEQALGEVAPTFDFFLNRVKNPIDKKHQEATIAGFFKWIETVDENFQADLITEFNNESDKFGVLLDLDTIDRAKENIKLRALELKNIDKVAEFENIVKAQINALKFLNEKDKFKLINNILDIKTVEELNTKLDDIFDIGRTMIAVQNRRNIVSKIQKELKAKPLIKSGTVKKAKFGYEATKLFQSLKAINKLTQEKAQDKIEAIAQKEDKGFEDKLASKMLTFKSNKFEENSKDLLQSLLDDIIELKRAGKEAKSEKEFLARLNKEEKKTKLLDVLTKKAKSGILKKGYIQEFGNWESSLNAIFNEDISEEYSLLLPEESVFTKTFADKEIFKDKSAKAYGFKSSHQFDGKVIENLQEKYIFRENIGETKEDIEMNKMNIIQAYVWSKNSVLEARLINQFGEIQLTEMLGKLDNNDVAFANVLLETVDVYYEDANKQYIKVHGLELPRVENYFPSQVQSIGKDVDLLNDFIGQSTSPSATKARSGSQNLIMKFGNPVAQTYKHINQMNRFIMLSDTLSLYNSIFKSHELRRAITNKLSERTYQSFLNNLSKSTLERQGKLLEGSNTIVDFLVNNWVTSKIALKPSIFIKQLLSWTNYISFMPVSDWIDGASKNLMHPKQTIKFMMQDEYLQARFGAGAETIALQKAIESTDFPKLKELRAQMSFMIRVGDIGAIIFGGKSYVDYLMKQGLSKEQAFAKFRQATLRTQQASLPSSLSNTQYNLQEQLPLLRALFAFRNTPNQYARMSGDAVISFANGDISKTQLGKQLFLYTFFNSFLYRSATSLSLVTLLMTGDDEPLKADIIQSIFDLNSKALFMFGDIYSYISDTIVKGISFKSSIPVEEDLMKIIDKAKGDITFEDLLFVIEESAALITGVPANTAKGMAVGVTEAMQGKKKGIFKALGYTDYTASAATGEKRNKGKKKKKSSVFR